MPIPVSAEFSAANCPLTPPFRYQRREPERTVLHRIVRENLAAFLAEAAERYPSGDLPEFIKGEFDRYLRCGLLCHGFARVRCPDCSDQLLVAFSCKNRGICPSCSSRRMADSAAHLCDHVLPAIPVRQWVLTLPKRLRFVVAWRPKLISLALRLFLRALFSWQRRHARRRGIENPLCGAITFIQRFGSALNLNLHYHTLVPDGVFAEDAAGEVQFHPLAPPTLSDLEKLLRKLVPRLLRALASDSDLADPSDWMQVLAQWLQTGAGSPSGDPPKGLCVLAEGFSLHAGVAVDAFDRDALERLARYCARPPLALRRLSLTQDGQILYRTKHAAPGAPRLLRFSPTQFLGRLAALVPPPRSHLLRFHGVFAPHSSYRDRVVPVPPPSPEPAEPNIQTSSQATATNDPVGTCTSDVPALRPLWLPPLLPKVRSMRPDSRLDWATLLRRTFGIDVLHCDRCGGRRRLMALVSDEKIAQKILAQLGLPTQAPASSPVRAPPQAAEFPGCNDQDGIDPIPLSWQS